MERRYQLIANGESKHQQGADRSDIEQQTPVALHERSLTHPPHYTENSHVHLYTEEMDDTLVILGRQPGLGLAELESLYGSDKLLLISEHAARLSIMPCSIDFDRLGGAVKLCKMLTVLETTNWKEVEQFLVSVSPAQSERMSA